MSGARKAFGNTAERYAERLLVQKGWVVLDRQWRGTAGEVDLIALDGQVLVFVEVKARRGQVFGTAEEAVDTVKAERLLDLGAEYLQAHPEHEDRLWRVDMVAITVGRRGTIERLTHLANICEDE